MISFAPLLAAQVLTVELVDYRVSAPSAAQDSASRANDMRAFISLAHSSQIHSRGIARVELGQDAKIEGMGGTVRFGRDQDGYVVTLKAMPFYSGTPLRLSPCAPTRIGGARYKQDGKVKLSVKVVTLHVGC